MEKTQPKLALLGGSQVIEGREPEDLFKWPIIGKEDEEAALRVMRENTYSGYHEETEKFEQEFAQWQGTKYALAFCNGTMSLAAAMFAVGLGAGDEIICPTKTYWATIASASSLGATAVFCNVDDSLCIDPDDIERCITPKTKALMIVHYGALPCDMDRIMPIVKKHNLFLIEDVSHAQGGLYKGKKLGTFGHVSAMSLMSGKSFAAGELGILVTDHRRFYERALAYGHYDRNSPAYIHESEEIKPYFGMPLSGFKGRANQLCSAIARVQLKYYDERCAEIRKAMNYFWDLLEGVPGIRAIRVDESEGSNMAGWYAGHGLYIPEELHGLSVNLFCEAVRAEIKNVITFSCSPGGNFCLHTHEYFKSFDLMNMGKPSRIAFTEHDVRKDDDLCNPSVKRYCFSVPWFKHFNKEWIELFAQAYRKVAENHMELLELENSTNKEQSGRWYGLTNE